MLMFTLNRTPKQWWKIGDVLHKHVKSSILKSVFRRISQEPLWCDSIPTPLLSKTDLAAMNNLRF